jgi:hypothetical protein
MVTRRSDCGKAFGVAVRSRPTAPLKASSGLDNKKIRRAT